ncbi:ankyrin repeat-containing domain protein [Trichoderma pleuroticola]
MGDMLSSSETIRWRLNAENQGPGSQYLSDGPGDQNIVSGSGTVVKINHQKIVFGMPDEGIPSMSYLAQNAHPTKSWPPEGPKRNDIVKWLTTHPNQIPVKFSHYQRNLLAQISQNTGEWLLEDENFLNWKESRSPSQILWMHGIPGSGKTMLVSLIIDSIEKEFCRLESACVYFFFQEDEKPRASLARVWATLLTQLLERSSDNIADDLKATFNSPFRRSAPLDSSEYFDLFKAQAATMKTVYLILDALDSCQNTVPEMTLGGLQKNLRELPNNVRILCTSREGRIGNELEAHHQLLITPKEEDVKAYIKRRITDDRTLKAMLADPKQQEEVIEEVTIKTLSCQMFLSAKLHMDHLSKQPTFYEISKALKSLPDSSLEALESWTKQIAQRVKKNDNGESLLAKHTFTWVAHAKVELNIKQMQDSYAIKMSKGNCYHDHRPVEDLIMRACTGLVTMDMQKATLGLVHKCVKEYLQKHEVIPDNADIEIGKTCLYFLINACNAKFESPLLQYAAKYWWIHLCGEQGKDDEEIDHLVMRFLTDNAGLTEVFMAMNETNDDDFAQMTGWHAAVYFDLLPWSDRLQPQVDIDSRCADGQTALHWAVGYGRLEFLKILIQKSANPNLRDINGDTPLHKALLGSASNKEGIVEILINGQARLDIKNKKGMSPLESAIRYGPTSIAKIMIESQSNVSEEFEGWTSLRLVFYYGLEICNVAEDEGLQTNSEGWNQLQMAARDHARFLTKLLLKRGVDLNTPTKDGWTPLVFTAKNGDLSKMRRLLTRYPNPAKVHLQDGSGKTPLWWATKFQKAAAIELLVDYGAEVNEVYTDGSTPLYEAVKNKDNNTVQLLVNRGANVNLRLANGSTLLIEATKLDDRLTACVLLDAGARSDDRDLNNNKSALIHAIEREDKELAWLLVIKGALLKKIIDNNTFIDVQNPLKVALGQSDYHTAWLLCANGACPNTVVDANRNTLLHWAVDRGDLRDVRFLIDHGASINVKAEGDLTPIHYAVLRGREDILDLLASHASEPTLLDVTDSRGNTALTLATLKKNWAAIQILIRHGASCNITDMRGLRAIHHAARLGFDEGLSMLLRGGADPKATDHEYFTAVHHAINGGNADSGLVKILKEAGSELEAPDRSGRTPLMLAAQLGRDELVACLLSAGVDTEVQDKSGYKVFDYAMNCPVTQKLLTGHAVWN